MRKNININQDSGNGEERTPTAPDNQRGCTPPVMSQGYLQGYLQNFIGCYVRVDFLIGTGSFIDREGILTKVGIDYLQLKDPQTGTIIICDLYSVKFVRVINQRRRNYL